METEVKKFVEGYKKHNGSDVKVQKTPGASSTSPSKSDLEEPQGIDNYRSFVGQLMWYTTKEGSDVENAEREFAVQMIPPGQEHWKALERLIRYLKGNRQMSF